MQSKEKGSLMKMRMKLIDTESFLNMPVSARCLYFELLHREAIMRRMTL